MVHLVCSSRSPPSSPKADTIRENHESPASSNISSTEHSGSTTPSPSQETLHTDVSSSSSGVRHRSLPQAQSNPLQSHPFSYIMQGDQFPGQGVPAGFPVYPAFSPLQMIWWQQMYARQYYMQYQAAVSAQATSSTESPPPPAQQPTDSQHAPANEPPAAPNVAPPENRPVNQNVQMNAQGGPVMNEEEFNRDWLDWMYTFSRAAILLSIVYFYSSFSRFIMVMGAMLLVYLHQAGWFPFRPEAIQQPAANNMDMNHDGQNVNNAGLEEMERLMDDGIDEDSGEDVIDVNADQHPGFMASAWSFITTFFTSLIPEGPPQVGN
nr:homocysteine-responsive endoplasmic reticulum-resident ubiquitin-like domain member 2 protein isoform X2 [Anolis sagrei ordinatus]